MATKLRSQLHKKQRMLCNSKTSRQGRRVKKLKLNLEIHLDREKKYSCFSQETPVNTEISIPEYILRCQVKVLALC